MTDWDPELYNRFRRYRAEPAEMIFTRLFDPAHAGRDYDRIIDLGCGSGENTIELARRGAGADVIGLDLSPTMIAHAKQNWEQLDPSLRARIEFRLGDFRELADEGAYSVIFSNAALQWIADHRKVLAACHRALKPDGELVIQVPANDHETAQATIAAVAAEVPWRQYLGETKPPSRTVGSPDHYATMLGGLGFDKIDCYYHIFHHPMRGPAEVLEWCRATALREFQKRLPVEQREAFITELGRGLERAYGTTGALTFHFRRLFMWARRRRGEL
ncbi:MAG: methyltransferase domain-containing protein [Candidatus Binataceae bacterium]